MGEVMICRGGSGSSSGSGGTNLFDPTGGRHEIREFIMENTNWVVPNAIDNKFSIVLFGGGGGGWFCRSNKGAAWCCGGGSGWMNNDILTLTPGTTVSITIGQAGSDWMDPDGWNHSQYIGNGANAGTSSFGTYLSAYGGDTATVNNGGNGGAGGGGVIYGGKGYQFGGGGAFNKAGDGGPWGGGGASCTYYSFYGDGGNGGIYGGAGGGYNCIGGIYGGNVGENGINTAGFTTVDINIFNNQHITGFGLSRGGGGGGYGGNGYDGGGGYGGDGGHYNTAGGGGYGSNGLNGANCSFSSNNLRYGGGGGGWLADTAQSDDYYGKSGGVGFSLYSNGSGGCGESCINDGNWKFKYPASNGICFIRYFIQKQ